MRGLGGAGLGLTGLGLFGHQHFEDEAFSATPSCTLVAEQEEGPYYLDLEKIRKDGIAVFRTIYPGWYRGRATHIHLKAHLGGKAGSRYTGGHVAHTGQMFFSDALTDRVARLAPYSSRTVTRVRNKADHVYTQQGGSGSILSLTARDKRSIRSGFVGRITLGIDPGQT